MPERKKVLESLNKALTRVGYGDMDNVTLSEVEEAIESAIAILRAQEPVAPRYKDPYHAYCSACGCRIPLKIKARYCHKCGKAVKWND